MREGGCVIDRWPPEGFDYGKISEAVKKLQKAKKAMDDDTLPLIVRKSVEKTLKNPIHEGSYSIAFLEYEGKDYVSVSGPLVEFGVEEYGKIKEIAKGRFEIDGSREDRITLKPRGEEYGVELFREKFLVPIDTEADLAKELAEKIYRDPFRWWERDDIFQTFRQYQPVDEGDWNRRLLDSVKKMFSSPESDGIKEKMAEEYFETEVIEKWRKRLEKARELWDTKTAKIYWKAKRKEEDKKDP